MTKHPWAVSIAAILGLAVVVLFWNVGAIGLIDETEPLFVEASRQMFLTGDWITPSFNNEPRFDKPPLIYWLMVLVFKVFGVSEWAARLPSVLAALAIGLFCFFVLHRFHQEPTPPSLSTSQESVFQPFPSPSSPFLAAFLAAAMLLLNPNTFFWGRTGYSDMLLNACIGGSLLAFFCGYAQPERSPVQQRWYLAFYGLMSLAILTKGPIGFVLPGLIIGAFALYLGNGRSLLQELRLVRGGLLVAGLSVPWYIAVTLANGEAFIDSFFGYHNVERFTTVVNQHAGPWYFHILVILVGFFPWSVFLPVAIARLRPLQRQYWQQQPRDCQLGLFALFWFAIILGFFTIATTKYFSYTLPLMPAASILVALLWREYFTQPATLRSPGFLGSSLANLATVATMGVVVTQCPKWLDNDPWMPHLGDRLQESGLPVLGGIIWGVCAIGLGMCWVWNRRALWLVNLLGFLAFVGLVVHPMLFIADAERQLPLRQVAQAAVQAERSGETLVMVGFKKPSLVYYTQRPVVYLRSSEYAQKISQVARQANSPTVLVVGADASLLEAGLNPGQSQEISRSGIYRLIRVAPIAP